MPKFNKITLSTLSDPPPVPLRLIHIFKINNIHIKESFYPHAATPPSPLAYPHSVTPALPYPQNVNNLPFFWNPFLTSLAAFYRGITYGVKERKKHLFKILIWISFVMLVQPVTELGFCGSSCQSVSCGNSRRKVLVTLLHHSLHNIQQLDIQLFRQIFGVTIVLFLYIVTCFKCLDYLRDEKCVM